MSNLDEKAKKLAKQLREEILKDSDKKYDELLQKFNEVSESLTKKEEDLIMKVYTKNDVKKDVTKLGKKEKMGAFMRAMITNNQKDLNAILQATYTDADKKALSEGVNADGGFLVPQHFWSQLVVERVSQDNMRSRVTVIPMRTNVLTIPKHDTGPEVYWTAEGATKTTTTADFSQPTITAYKLAAILYITDELIDDAAFGLVDIMTKKFADKLQEAEDTAIINGSGVAQPTGIFVNATVGTRVCAGNLDFDDVIDLIYDLDAKYRSNAAFIVHNTNVRELRKLKDGNGQYLWQAPVAAGQPATIQGYPVITTYKCPEAQIAFGDYKEAYWLGDRQRMTVKISQDTTTAFTQDKTAIRVVQRIGGDVIQPLAIRKLITIP